MINLAIIHHPNLIISVGSNHYEVRTRAEYLLGTTAWTVAYLLPGGATFNGAIERGEPVLVPCSEKLARAFPVGGIVRYLIQDCILILPEEKV